MSVRTVFGALISLVIGSVLPAGEVSAGRERHEEPVGYSVQGNGFYVWDEDREEAERWASELESSRPAHGS